MKIAVPMTKTGFCAHFGGAETFALYTADQGSRTIDERLVVAPPEHGHGVYPMWLKQVGAEVVLAGGMGPRASNFFAQYGIDVVLGVQGDDPDALVQQFLEGTLEATGEPCRDHGFHDCGHHHPKTTGGDSESDR
jgi:predicted Fe-Mo cluster-binding NifX family protein